MVELGILKWLRMQADRLGVGLNRELFWC